MFFTYLLYLMWCYQICEPDVKDNLKKIIPNHVFQLHRQESLRTVESIRTVMSLDVHVTKSCGWQNFEVKTSPG